MIKKFMAAMLQVILVNGVVYNSLNITLVIANLELKFKMMVFHIEFYNTKKLQKRCSLLFHEFNLPKIRVLDIRQKFLPKTCETGERFLQAMQTS